MFERELPRESDIVIVGGGVVGLAIARRLSRYDVRVVVLEREVDVGFGVTSKNMGVIHPFIPQFKTKKFELCLKGNAMFDVLAKELDFPFKRVGLLIVALNLIQSVFLRLVKLILKRKGIIVRSMSGKEIRKIEPKIVRKVRYGLFIPTAGVTDPHEFVYALAENAVQNGVKIVVETEVKEITRKEGGLLVKTNRGDIKTRYVINAAGLYSDEIMEKAGLRKFEMEPGIGVMVIFDREKKDHYKHIVAEVPFRVDPRTKGGGAGVTVDGYPIWGPNLRLTEHKDDIEIKREDLSSILKKFRRLFPDIDSDDIKYYYLGVRPAAKQGDYVIGKTELRGFINVAAIQSPGLTAAPAIAEEVVQILIEEGLQLTEKDNYNPIRHGIRKVREMSIREVDDYLKTQDTCEIICRDPLITLSEVKEAIKRGATTIKGVLSRIGLGWDPLALAECSDRIAEVLSSELGKPLHEITFEGPGTEFIRRQQV